ncbi:MAG TPA: PAS domain S-box protein [Smithella sp.]|jgi:diguanylate cyclase (GGDEF)-like protein/PAS domain S-box-containing protein|nr:PAS domain S-box protein [Smithella sp.]HOO35502.1 PAS domain S-box protein [Smithella sp.]HPK22545.1 PAS domain S-box protein [Smithella sp.]HPR16243.1 PAS domain S-box protein [Smithella sp.]
MIEIDMRIIFAEYGLSVLLCLIVIVSLWWQNRKRAPEIILWLIDYILQFAGIMLIALRGILPDFMTIVVANLFIVGGTVILYEGLCRYVGQESRQKHNYVMLAIFTSVHIFFTYIAPHMGLRTINFSVALFYICIQGAWLMLYRVASPLRQATKITGIVFAAFCIVNIIQIIINLIKTPSDNAFVSGAAGVIAVLIYETLFFALTFSLFLLISRSLAIELENELTRRMRTAEELRQNQEKFAKAFQTSPYAISITQMKDGKFLDINDAFVNITGYSREEIMKESSMGLNLWVDKEDREEMVSILRQGLPVVRKEYRFRKKNGEILTGLYSSQIINITEEPCLLSSINDITEQKQAEWTLKERIKELNCLYGISAVLDEPGISLNDIMNKAVKLLPAAMRFPDITGARIILEETVFQTGLFKETPWQLTEKITVNGKPEGQVNVCYPAERFQTDEKPFLDSERQLLKAVAEQLGHFIEQKRAEEQIQRNATRLTGLLNIMQHRTQTTQEFLDYALDEVIRLTESKVGYIYLYNENSRQFVLNSWSKDVMKECTIPNPQTRYELAKTGIWGEAVRQRKPIIVNDFPADHPLKKGYPEGHAPLFKFLTVPVFDQDQIVAVVGIANKARDYDETDVLQLTLFMDAVWKSVDLKMGEEKLRKSEERFKQLAEVFPETIFEADAKGNLTYANEHGLKHFGLTEQDIAQGVNIFDFVSPNDRKAAWEKIQNRIQGTQKGYLEYEALKKDGSPFHALALSVPIAVDGVPVGIRGFILDITKRKQAEEALRKSEENYHFIADHTADHIWTMDMFMRFTYSSPSVIKTLGYTADEFMARKIDEFFTPESLVDAQKLLAEELERENDPTADPNRSRTLPSHLRHKNGHWVWLESSLTFIRDASMKPIGVLGVTRDITERKKSEEQIKHLATHDLLTDLPSLRLARDRMVSAMNMARRYKKSAAIMFLDLDGFKNVNDTLGHDAGDYVLKQVAQRLLSCVRETDTVARVGGDEFLIIATEIHHPDNAAHIAEKVIQTVSQPIMINGEQAVVGTSIGIALYPEHSEEMDRLIKLADEAMYKVKNAGKNNFRFVNDVN